MGLDGLDYSYKMEEYDLGSDGMSDECYSSSPNSSTSGSDSEMTLTDFDGTAAAPLDILLQAQALLRKSKLYQKIDAALRKASVFRPAVYSLPQTDDDEGAMTGALRDHAVSNLKFLNVFYGYSPAAFALAVNMMDRFLGKVAVQPRYLSCIAISCYFIAIRTHEDDHCVPTASELVKLSQCGCTTADLSRMERIVLERLHWELHAVTPLNFLQYFYEVLADKDSRVGNQVKPSALIAKLEVLTCQFEFTKFRAETMALALLYIALEESKIFSGNDLITAIIELQYYCQISDGEFVQCREMITDYLLLYYGQPTKVPRLQLQWTISRRTMNKLKPSTRCILDLEPIMEDEADEDTDDAGPFDSENDEAEKLAMPQIIWSSAAVAAANYKEDLA